MYETPHIHLLETPLHKYFYDVNTNQIVQVSEAVYEELGRMMKGKIDEKAESDAVKKLKADGFLLTKRPLKIRHPQSDLLEYYLAEDIHQITLQLTQQCNFRCAYCTYAPKDFEYQRTHTSNVMSFDTAKKAIDFYVAHSGNRSTVTIGLYGGEPLLEFELFKKIVRYAECAFEGKEIMFTTTTNGSLFTDEVAQFFNKHNINYMISLDGTKEIHDRSRKFAANGKGTFDLIQKNILNMKEKYPSLFQRGSINVVIDPRFPSNPLHDMFTKNPLWKDINIQSTLIEDAFEIEKVAPTEEYLLQDRIHAFKVYMSLLERYPQNNISKIAWNNFQRESNTFDRSMSPASALNDSMAPGGPCVPGRLRLFIDYQGRFFPCERVSEASDPMQIGDLEHGFDFDRAQKLLNIGQLTENACKNCWVIRHCMICARRCDNLGELSAEIKLSGCYLVKKTVEKEFLDQLMLRELSYEDVR